MPRLAIVDCSGKLLERKADVLSVLDDWAKRKFEQEDEASFYTFSLGIKVFDNFIAGENPYRKGHLDDFAIKERRDTNALRTLLKKTKRLQKKYSIIYIFTDNYTEVEEASKGLNLSLEYEANHKGVVCLRIERKLEQGIKTQIKIEQVNDENGRFISKNKFKILIIFTTLIAIILTYDTFKNKKSKEHNDFIALQNLAEKDEKMNEQLGRIFAFLHATKHMYNPRIFHKDLEKVWKAKRAKTNDREIIAIDFKFQNNTLPYQSGYWNADSSFANLALRLFIRDILDSFKYETFDKIYIKVTGLTDADEIKSNLIYYNFEDKEKEVQVDYLHKNRTKSITIKTAKTEILANETLAFFRAYDFKRFFKGFVKNIPEIKFLFEVKESQGRGPAHRGVELCLVMVKFLKE